MSTVTLVKAGAVLSFLKEVDHCQTEENLALARSICCLVRGRYLDGTEIAKVIIGLRD